MKYILLFLTLALNSCSCGYIHSGDIINTKEYFNNKECRYTTSESNDFFAPYNVYEIGDTVKFCK